MAQEIELKFIVDPQAIAGIRHTLDALNGQHEAPRQLLNMYYETHDGLLRRHDMGLRIRGDGGRYEMTMKIAGRAIGGLYQRPEYNIALSKPELDLALLPAQIWPEGLSADSLQPQLSPLFSTDFSREKWVITHGASRIELALDRGAIKAGECAEPICELELELLSGATSDVLELAQQLLLQPGLRQGNLSKAARGYQLAAGNIPRDIHCLNVSRPAAKASVEQGLEAALEMALNHWQYHEELWLRGNKAAKKPVQEAVSFVRHTLAVFGGVIPRKASAHLRDSLSTLESELSRAENAEALAFGLPNGQTKLALTRWLVERQWRAFVDEKKRGKLDESFKRFADIHLSRYAAELKEVFRYPLADHYGDQLPRLARGIDAVRALAGVYDNEQIQPWLANWQSLSHAIAVGQSGEIERYRTEAISQAPFWLHSGN